MAATTKRKADPKAPPDPMAPDTRGGPPTAPAPTAALAQESAEVRRCAQCASCQLSREPGSALGICRKRAPFVKVYLHEDWCEEFRAR